MSLIHLLLLLESTYKPPNLFLLRQSAYDRAFIELIYNCVRRIADGVTEVSRHQVTPGSGRQRGTHLGSVELQLCLALGFTPIRLAVLLR